MLPQLPGVNVAVPHGNSRGQHRPPSGFRPSGAVASAAFASRALFGGGFSGAAPSAAQKAGLRYEEHFHRFASGRWETSYLPTPWLEFFPQGQRGRFGKRRLCQPDGLLLLDDRTVVFECKITHRAEAAWQLRHLYAPVVRALFPNKPVVLAEVTRSFDPSTVFPEPFERVEFEALLAPCAPLGALGVVLWKP